MKEQRTAVHFDGTRQQAAEIVDVPVKERWCETRAKMRLGRRCNLRRIMNVRPALRGQQGGRDFVFTELPHGQRGESLVCSVDTRKTAGLNRGKHGKNCVGKVCWLKLQREHQKRLEIEGEHLHSAHHASCPNLKTSKDDKDSLKSKTL